MNAQGDITLSKERILKEAAFSSSAVPYWVAAAGLVLAATVIGIPLAVIILPIVLVYRRLQYRRMRVILTSRDLKVHRGVLNREEKTIPLEKITDLAVFQGPLMRVFGVKGMRVETAGQSSGDGALVTVVGIEGTEAFRDMVLNQRDRVADRDDVTPQAGVASAGAERELLETVREMRDALNRIEGLLRERPRQIAS